MKEKVGLNTRKDPPKGLIGLQLSLYAELGTPTKGERDEGCDGQAITSTGRQKIRAASSRWTEGPFPLAQKNRGDEAD